MINLKDWQVRVPYGESVLGYQADHLANRLEILSDLGPEWSVKLDLRLGGAVNVIDLGREGSVLYADLMREMLGVNGAYECQLRGLRGETVAHSSLFTLIVRDAINAVDAFPPMEPTEMAQMEARVTEIRDEAEELTLHPPEIGANGNWWVRSDCAYVDSGAKAQGDTPEIKNGVWWIGGTDTGVPASGGEAMERITNTELEEILK